MNRILPIVFALIWFLTTTSGQTTKDIETILRINNYLLNLEQVGFYGSVVVEVNGEKKISKGYGYSDFENQIENSPQTTFDIGSITKQFTAAAILKLEMQGKLSTSDKISKYFEQLSDDKASITIHDLLRHQAGLISNVGNDYESISETEFLEKVFSSELKFSPGTNFSYSNIGYSLLAMIIEKVANQTYEAYLYENLWKPAQMEMTGYTRPAFGQDFIAVGYSIDEKWGKPTDKQWDISAPYWHLKGNGGILSTTEDMYHWQSCLMTDIVLSNEAKQKFFHPELRPDETNTSYYAYGWDVFKTNRNTTRIWHNGSNRIFYADFLIYPDEGVTIITLSNKSHPDFNRLSFEISKIIFNPNYIPEIPAPDNVVNRSFTNRIIKTIKEYGLAQAKEVFYKKDKSEDLLEFLMRQEGFNHLDNEEPETALLIFEMNAFAYPASAKSLQGLAEGYMETGNNELALKYFNESLHINPDNPFVKDMVKRLLQNSK